MDKFYFEKNTVRNNTVKRDVNIIVMKLWENIVNFKVHVKE